MLSIQIKMDDGMVIDLNGLTVNNQSAYSHIVRAAVILSHMELSIANSERTTLGFVEQINADSGKPTPTICGVEVSIY